MDRTTGESITAAPTGHTRETRELREAINAVLDGLAAVQAIAGTLRPTAPALDWVIGKLGHDAVRALDVATRIERASCQAVAA